jgi:hypothetical protein
MLNQNEKLMKNEKTFTLITCNNKNAYEIITNYNESNAYDKSLYTVIDHYESLEEAIADKDFYSQCEEEEEALHAQFVKYVL